MGAILPIPALPDAERRSSYAANASTGPFNVGFPLYCDGVDYPNWVGVYLNGILQAPSAFILTSPSGPIGTIQLPITDARITFTAAVTGTVQIVGARHPRRLTQFIENRGISAHDQNFALTEVEATVRELFDLLSQRVVQVPPGDTQAMFPSAAARANQNAIFDSQGNLTPGAPVAGGVNVSAAMQPVVAAATTAAALALLGLPSTFYVSSIANLRALTGGVVSAITLLDWGNGAGGYGLFKWNAGSVAADDGGSIIAPNLGGGRWIRQPPLPGIFTPEMFGAFCDGVHDDAPAIRAAMLALSNAGGGTLWLSVNKTYLLASYSDNTLACIKALANVNIVGAGHTAVLKLASGVNTAIQFAWIIYSYDQSGVYQCSNTLYADFTIDYNGQNNDNNGAWYGKSIMVGADNGDNAEVRNVKFINNSGSNCICFGRNSAQPSFSNVRIRDCHFLQNGDAISTFPSLDHSSCWMTAVNGSVTGCTFDQGPQKFGTAIELHGTGVSASGNVINAYSTGIIISTESAGNVSSQNISAKNNIMRSVNLGVLVSVKDNSSSDDISVDGNQIELTSTPAGGIDAGNQVSTVGTICGRLSIRGNSIKAQNLAAGANANAHIYVGQWSNAAVKQNESENAGGAFLATTGHAVATAMLDVSGNTVNQCCLRLGVGSRIAMTIANAGVTQIGLLNVQGNAINSALDYGISNGLNAVYGLIANNAINGVVGGIANNVSNTGTGVDVGLTSVSAPTTGGFTVKQGMVTAR